MKAPVLSCFLFLLLNSPAAEAGGVKGRSLKTTARRQQRHLKGSSKSSESSSKKQVGPTRRDCTAKSSKSSKKKGGGSSGLQFECVTRGEGVDDKIRFNVVPSQDNESLTISVEYKQKGDDVDDLDTEDEIETEIKTSYGITFEKIIEYRQPADILIVDDPSEESQSSVAVTRTIDGPLEMDNVTTFDQEEDEEEEEEVDPNNLAFNWENDEIVQTIDLGDWEEFSDIEDDGSTIQFSITSLEGHARFYFTIAMDADDNNDDLSVNKMKIDFELTSFPWIAEDSYVALVSSVTSGQQIKVLSDDDDEQLSSPSKKGHHHTTTKKEVQISFNDAAGVMDFLPFGDYTWKEEAVALPRDLVLNNGNETVDMENNVTTAQTRSADTTTIQVVATSPISIELDSEDYDYNSEAATAANQQQNNGENDFNSNQIIAFSFVGKPARKAENIYWDPSVGVGYSDDSAASSNNKKSSAATVSLVSLVTMVFPLVLSFF